MTRQAEERGEDIAFAPDLELDRIAKITCLGQTKIPWGKGIVQLLGKSLRSPTLLYEAIVDEALTA